VNSSCGLFLHDVEVTSSSRYLKNDNLPRRSESQSNLLCDRIAHVHKTNRPNFTLMGVTPNANESSDISISPELKCQSKLYPLYSVDMNISVAHVLIVMDVIAYPNSRSVSSKSSRSSSNPSTSRKHAKNSSRATSSSVDLDVKAIKGDGGSSHKKSHGHGRRNSHDASGKSVSSASTSSSNNSNIHSLKSVSSLSGYPSIATTSASGSIPTINQTISPPGAGDNSSGYYDNGEGFDFFNDEYDNLIDADGYNDMWMEQDNNQNSSSSSTAASNDGSGSAHGTSSASNSSKSYP
jgi:hypothetical protein